MIFSVTERGTYKRCKRQAVLASKNGRHLTKLFGPLHLARGSIVHRAHQLWLEDLKKPPDQRKSLYLHALDASVETQAKAEADYKRKIGVAPTDAEMATVHEAIEFALAMCENYEIRWGQPLPDEYTLIGAEQKVRIPVEATRHECPDCRTEDSWDSVSLGYTFNAAGEEVPCSTCNGTGEEVHVLEGKLDGLIMHKSGRLDVLEHKTYSARPKEHALRRNDQFRHYSYLVSKLAITDQVAFTAYDGMWSRMKVPRGSTFESLFLRLQVPHTQEVLGEIERFLPLELNAMAETYRNFARYGAGNVNDTAYTTIPWQGCRDCPFDDEKAPLCDAYTEGNKERINSIVASSYTERTDDLEDTEDTDETN